jgi:glycosyltransferase involved in cell wall biosynthesis
VPERRVLVVPHGGPVRPAREDAARPDRLLLVASYNDLNVRGVAWLARDVWPTLRAAVPGVELAICGNVAAKLGPMPAGIVARGFVPSLEEEYEAARVVLCPSPGGTGLAVKAVDALCHGRPVVCTPAATAGLAIGETAGVFVADRADDFAAAVRALLADDRLWRRAVAGAAAQAAARFAPEAAFAPLVDELTQCLARSSAGCRA